MFIGEGVDIRNGRCWNWLTDKETGFSRRKDEAGRVGCGQE